MFIYILIGFVVVDLYGMIDNTYGMYYFMIPVVILMASLDCTTKEEIERIWWGYNENFTYTKLL